MDAILSCSVLCEFSMLSYEIQNLKSVSMNKHALIVLLFACAIHIYAREPKEQLLLNENFQGWTASSASQTATTINAVTYYGDSIKYTLYNVAVMPSYTAKNSNGVTSVGAVQTQKVDPANSYFIISGFPNVTKTVFKHSYTGGTRGCIISAKGDGDADWVVLMNANTRSAAGQTDTFNIGKNNVSLRFQGNMASQNAYLHDLIVYGMTDKVLPVLDSINYSNGDVIPYQGGTIRLVFSSLVKRNKGAILLGSDTIADDNITIKDSVVTIRYNALKTDASYAFFVPAGAFVDDYGMPTASSISFTFRTIDTVMPTLAKISITDGTNLPVNGFISFVMSESCIAGTEKATLGSKSITPAISGSNSNLVYINYSGLAYDKDYTLTIPKGALTDLTGNAYEGISLSFHTEINARGDTLFTFTPSAANMTSTSGTVRIPVNATDTIEFGGVANAGPRSAESFTYSFKTSYIQLPQLPSVGELDMYIQCGGGTAPQEYYLQKYNPSDNTWNTVETFILGTNDRSWFRSAAAQSSVPVRLRIQPKEAQLWLYTISAYAYEKAAPVDDGKAPYVVSSLPDAGFADVPVNGSIKLVFSENVGLGNNDITFDGKKLSPGIIGKNVTLLYNNLKYSTSYTLDIPAGAFKDEFGNPSVAFSVKFTTKTKPAVTAKLFDFVVDPKGNGNGKTIQSAFDAVPAGNSSPFLIFVMPGVYDERPSLAETKTNVSLIGADRDMVIITGNKRSGVEGFSTSTCQTVEILADNFYCENLTIRNTAGINAGQAVALKVYADKAVFRNVLLTGFQDTHLTANTGTDRQYYLNCEIHGSVDFIFGNGVAFFDESLIYLEDRNTADVIAAPSTSAENKYGYIFSNCTIDGASSQDGAYNLGRPWQNRPRAVYLNTKMNILPSSGAWINMSTIPALFAEFGSVNASNYPVDVSGRNSAFSYVDSNTGSTVTGNSEKSILSSEEASQYTISKVLGGADAWDARLKTETTASPANLANVNDSLRWSTVEGAICYGIRINDSIFVMTKVPSAALFKGNNKYDVVAFSEYGAISEASSLNVSYLSLDKAAISKPCFKSTIVDESIGMINAESVSMLDIYNLSGRRIISVKSGFSEIPVNCLKPGSYIARLILKDGETYFERFMKK